VGQAFLTLGRARSSPNPSSRFYDSEIPDLHLAFIKDEKGNVTGLTLNTGPKIYCEKAAAPVPVSP